MPHETQTNCILEPEQTYHYAIWNKSNYTSQDLHSITLHCCSLSDCFFIRTILGDSDWDSCQIENCIFQELSFENSDITSTHFENCKFLKVSFKGTTTGDITFTNCEFIECNFNHIGLNNSSFRNCKFRKLKLRQSTTTLNAFTDCCFTSSKISGNFLYNIFSNTHFEKTQIDYMLLASNFGFTTKNFAELAWDRIDYKAIQQNLLDNKDVISAAIIALNINEGFFDYAILACLQIIINQLKNGILVRNEQFLFVKAIVDRLWVQKKLSLYTIIYLMNLLESVKLAKSNIAIQKSWSTIQQVNGMLFEYYHQIISQAHADLTELNADGIPITLKLVYHQEPSIPICYLLEQMMIQLDMPKPYPTRIKTEVGSFIEWIQGYDNMLKCFQLLISILGLGISLKSAHFKKSAQSKKENPNVKKHNILSKNIQPQPVNNMQINSAIIQIPESILQQLNTASTEESIHKTLNVFIANGVTVNNNFQGYNNFNFKDIEIL